MGEYVVLNNPRVFAFVFTLLVIIVSILRASTLVYGMVYLDSLAFIVVLSTPNAIIEGFGIFQTIERALRRAMTARGLAGIYGVFFVAALIEVSCVNLLMAAV